MAYAIMRMAKFKSAANLAMAINHNAREKIPANANAEWTKDNQYWGGNREDVMQRYHEMMPDKVRANAVHAVEVLITASPEYDGDWDKFMTDGLNWAHSIFGIDNLLHMAVHADEMTPHIHLIYMPLYEGKLSASHFIGGGKDKMKEMQDSFYEFAGRPNGLERGKSKEETKARHTPHTLAATAATLDKEWEQIKAAKFGVKQAWSELNAEQQIVAGITQHLHDLDQQQIGQFWSEYKERSPIFLEVCKSVAVEKVAAARQQQVDRRQPQQQRGPKR